MPGAWDRLQDEIDANWLRHVEAQRELHRRRDKALRILLEAIMALTIAGFLIARAFGW